MYLNELIEHIKSVLNNGPTPRSFRYTDRSIYFIIKVFRAKLLRNKAAKGYFVSDFNYQTLPCVSLEQSKLLDCNCLPTGVGCPVLRSTQPLPEILTGRNGYLLNHLTDMYGNDITLSTFQKFKYSFMSFYKKGKTCAFIHNGYLYIGNNTDLEKVSLTAIFFDPVEVNDCNDDVCFDPLTMEFPMDKELVDALLKMSYQELLAIAYSVPQDRENDTRDESAQVNVKVPREDVQD